MIGGTDIVYPTTAGIIGLDYCLRAARVIWPNAVFEDARPDAACGSFDDLRFDGLNEVFAYRDESVARKWESLGAELEWANTMIQVLCSPRSITVVVADPRHPEMSEFLAAIRAQLFAWDVPERLAA